MKIVNYKFYSDYLKNPILNKEQIFISKTKKSYLIGPKINSNFDEQSFYKRIISSSIYTINIYKKIFNNKAQKLIDRYIDKIADNEVIEIFKDDTYTVHSIVPIPGEKYEKE